MSQSVSVEGRTSPHVDLAADVFKDRKESAVREVESAVADADAEAETEAEEDELHDEDDHAGATAPAARAQAAENGHAAPEDAKHTNNSKTEVRPAPVSSASTFIDSSYLLPF